MKGIDYLLAALNLLDFPVELNIVGSGPEEAALKFKCNKLNIQCNFLGVIEMSQIGIFMESMDLIVLPSIAKDGWGVVISEALMTGTPVITTPSVGSSSVLINPIYGRCVPEKSAESIASSIKDLKSLGAFSDTQRETRKALAISKLSASAGAKYFLSIIEWRFNNATRPFEFYI